MPDLAASGVLVTDKHPYQGFIPKDARGVILGGTPPHRFCARTGLVKGDMDFYYGSRVNLFWDAMEVVFGEELSFIHTLRAAEKPLPYSEVRPLFESFLASHNLGIADTLHTYFRKGQSSADQDILPIRFNPRLWQYLSSRPQLTHLFCSSHHVSQWLLQSLLNSKRIRFIGTDAVSFSFEDEYQPQRQLRIIHLHSPSRAASKDLLRLVPPGKDIKDKSPLQQQIIALGTLYRRDFAEAGIID
ncbi:MAG: hypothetical protein LHW44_07865 [Candidatus Cloacimonetes bacterium]|nr:hypothetical protein [Candidatus Cloacimonadota bacterium]